MATETQLKLKVEELDLKVDSNSPTFKDNLVYPWSSEHHIPLDPTADLR